MNFVGRGSPIFVDAGAWIAYTNPKDRHHDTALALYAELRQMNVQLVTTDYIIDETVTRLRYDVHHEMAVRFLDFINDILAREELKLVRISQEIFDDAERFFRQHNTPRLSFTDCASFVVCKDEEITTAFGFDRHFQAMKLNLLS